MARACHRSRRQRHRADCANKDASKTFEPLNGEKQFEGVLVEFDGANVTVEIKIKTRKTLVTIPYEKIANARLAVTFS